MLKRFTGCLTSLVFGLLVLASSLHSPYVLADASDSAARWVPTGDLNTARLGHTATLLSNGKVLVVGGTANVSDSLAILDSAELYDPETGTWTFTGRLHAARLGHTATRLPDGRVLVVGGVGSLGGASTENLPYVAELYNPSTGTWTRTAIPTANRSDHTATLLQSGKVLLAGGSVGYVVGGVDLYDPVSDSWSGAGSLEIARSSHTATLLPNGRVLVTGGYNDFDFFGEGFVHDQMSFLERASFAELYDPLATRWSSWSETGRLNFARAGHATTLLPDGNVLVAGGYGDNAFPKSAELFDPLAGRWAETAALSVERSGHTATLLPNGQVLLVGGYQRAPTLVNKGAEIYDPAGAMWHITSSLNAARHAHTATLLSNGKVLVAGGAAVLNSSASATLRSAELYESGGPPTPSAGAIGAGFTGSWYDPAQSGHGFALQVLAGPPRQLLAYWFMFAPQGGQSWIAALGPIDGNRAVLPGVQTVGAGARFPPDFDAANARQESWGTLTFTFSDCNHGHVDWNPTTPGYGSGGMDLTRLTLPMGLTCQIDNTTAH